MIKKRPQESPILCMFLLLFFYPRMMLAGEMELLLSLKSSITDPLHYLSSWETSATFCRWQGVSCNNFSHVVAIELSGRNLSGGIPSSIFELPYVETINLSNNQLSGELPDGLFSGSSLRHLNLRNNNFSGAIPNGSIFTLETLDLSNNMLAGEIPSEIGSFSSLKFLDLGGNLLSGNIPISITNLTDLQVLTLASNQLDGRIPPGFGHMKSLKWIYLGYNTLSGEIPREIGSLTSLIHLDIVYNNLTGQIPSPLGNLTNLEYLFLYQNRLMGPLPKSIFGLRKLISLDLSDNSLSGEIPELVVHLQNLEILHLFSNNFTGRIPGALCSLPSLQVLQLWSNKFSGEIPKCLGKQNKLTVLDLSSNHLSGEIPESLCSSGNLSKLILFSNSLEGEIPEGLSTCKSLRRVRLQDNCLTGNLSSEFTKLPLVYFLDISSNNLSGRIDARNWEMPSLQMLNLAKNRFYGGLPDSFGSDNLENLDLSGNRFLGSIPRGFGNFLELMQLKLSENKISGEIPDELSSCKKLVSLDLSNNRLSGQIPVSFSELSVLGQLDLSDNILSGEIPANLGRMNSLVEVNISHNHFHGCLPSTGAFLAINASAVAGNVLCGGDTGSGLPPCRRVKGPTWWHVFTSTLGALIFITLTAFGIVFVRRRKHPELKRVENEDRMWELQFFQSKVSESITIEDILSSRKEQNMISRGKNWTSYKGKSITNDMQFVVREMNDINSIPPNFWADITEFGKVQHSNIIGLIGTCRSNKIAYLVYEFVEGTKLSEILRNLSWEKRRNVAIGIAKALRYLHCSRSVLVGLLSPEEIIVDRRDEPRLMLSQPDCLISMDNKSFMSSAYAAPETRETKGITEESDMYGFGLILIELLTGRSPGDAEFGMHQSIVEWARYCYSDCHLDSWVDPMIRDQALNDQKAMVATMNLALRCTAFEPTARPCAKYVSKTLESALSASRCISSSKLLSSLF